MTPAHARCAVTAHAVIGVGDLVSRSDMHGGRTSWGDVPLRVRNEVIANAALFRTSGPGIAWPGSGAQGHPSRVDVSYPVATVEEARSAVQDYVRMQPAFIKIWVDDRGGRKKTLTPPLYRAIVDEAHKYGVPVGVHNVTLSDAKELMKAGMDGWLHVPVRGGDTVDDELIAIVKSRIARNDRPEMWMTPSLITSWMNTQGGQRPAWLGQRYRADHVGRVHAHPRQLQRRQEVRHDSRQEQRQRDDRLRSLGELDFVEPLVVPIDRHDARVGGIDARHAPSAREARGERRAEVVQPKRLLNRPVRRDERVGLHTGRL